MPVRVLVTAGPVADCTQVGELINHFKADVLIADKGYDTDEIVRTAEAAGMETVIPPRSNRKQTRYYDRHLYKLRYLVENAFLRIKGWRGISTRYAKRAASYLAAVHLRCAIIWASIL